VSDRPGCLFGPVARLFNLGRGRRALTASSMVQHTQPHPSEAEAVARGRAATRRCLDALHTRDSVSTEVLDDVGSAVQALGATIDALAGRLAEARGWLHTRDVEGLRRSLVDLELESGGPLAAEQARAAEMRTIRDTLRQVDAVERGIPVLRARLQATVRSLEKLEGSVTQVTVDGLTGADGLVGRTQAQVTDTERALKAWQATVAELEGL